MSRRSRRRRRPLAEKAAAAVLMSIASLHHCCVPAVVSAEQDSQQQQQLLTDAKNRCCRHDDELPPIEVVAEADTLERVSCSMTHEYFQMKYEIPRQMGMFVGCDESWPARHRWTPEKLADRFSNSSLWRAKFDAESSVHYDEETEWSQIVEAMASKDFFYIIDTLENSEAPDLLHDFTQPKPIQNTVDLYASDEELWTDFPGLFKRRRWILFGSKFSGTPPHYDVHETDTWMASVSGHKWWIFYPKTLPRMVDTHGSVPHSVQCDSSCSYSDWDVGDWFASVGLFAEQEDYDGEHPFHVLQRPGETIYIPAGFAHAVWNMDETFGVTENWASPHNIENLWRFLLWTAETRIQQKFYDGLDSTLKKIVDGTRVPEPDKEGKEEEQQCYRQF